MHQNVHATRFVSLFIVSILYACSGEKSNNPSVNKLSEAGLSPSIAGAEVSGSAAAACDASLWDHVYSPKRLQQLAPCLSVTGVIDESNVDDDGDQHFLLKLDPGQDTLVNKRNNKKKSGDIVLEIVCANPTTMKKPQAACAGFTNSIPIPAVGTRVRATGTYVLDSHNGWVEIHPVSKLEKM